MREAVMGRVQAGQQPHGDGKTRWLRRGPKRETGSRLEEAGDDLDEADAEAYADGGADDGEGDRPRSGTA